MIAPLHEDEFTTPDATRLAQARVLAEARARASSLPHVVLVGVRNHQPEFWVVGARTFALWREVGIGKGLTLLATVEPDGQTAMAIEFDALVYPDDPR